MEHFLPPTRKPPIGRKTLPLQGIGPVCAPSRHLAKIVESRVALLEGPDAQTASTRVLFIGIPREAFHRVDPQGSVDTLPKVKITDRHELAEAFPAPIVIAPLRKIAPDASPHEAIGREQRHVRRTVERFEAPDHRQQIEPHRVGVGLDVGRGDSLACAGGLQNETPLAQLAATAG